MSTTVDSRARRDGGMLMVPLMLMVVIVLAAGGLVVDGGRAMSARRLASNVAEGAARAAVSSSTPVQSFDPATARAAAVRHAVQSGVAATDVTVRMTATVVTVEVRLRRRAVFLVLGGWQSITVTGIGSAQMVFSR